MHRTFPAVVFAARHGRRAAYILALALALILIATGLLPQGAGGWLLALVLAVAAWGVLRLAAEMIEVIADTLLPR